MVFPASVPPTPSTSAAPTSSSSTRFVRPPFPRPPAERPAQNPFFGGNSTKATSGINGAGTKAQAALGIPDTPKAFFDDTKKSVRPFLFGIERGADEEDRLVILPATTSLRSLPASRETPSTGSWTSEASRFGVMRSRELMSAV